MTNKSRAGLLGLLIAIGAGSTYAVAQPKNAAKPAETAATCDDPACADHGGECPMMQDGASMMGAMMVTSENTKDGAVLKLTAKTPADVPKIQQMAEKMAKHMQSGCKMMHGNGGGMGKSSGHGAMH